MLIIIKKVVKDLGSNIVIEVDNLKKKYSNVQALNGLNLRLESGQIIGLIGPNGSGKSTLLKIISGLVRADSGEIRVLGEEVGRSVKSKIAFLPEINHLYKWMSIKDVIKFYSSQFDDFDVEKAYELIEFMNLKPELIIKNLSKGMVARVKIILTMSRQVPLIIMDEPLAGIDPQSRAKILESLISEYRMGEQTIILSTHEVMEAERFFDYVIFLEYGDLKLQGNSDDLRAEHQKSIQELVKEVFI